jgi:DNA-binding HxlR family transcriptional regulator
MARSYDQHCSLAHALDLVGERWTLLIVRELLAGPQRFTDLAEGLVAVPSNVLTARLRDMEANDIVHRRQLPPPASSVTVYELTQDGRALSAAVTELARWGMRTLPGTTRGRPFHARWLVLALRTRFDPAAARGVTEAYEFCIDDDDVACLEVEHGEANARIGRATDPAVRISADADTLVSLSSGAITEEEAIARGARIEGKPRAIQRMRSILPG